MKLRHIAAAAAALGLLAASGAASANVLGHIVTAEFSDYGNGSLAGPGEHLVTLFEGGPGLGQTAWLADGYSLSGTGLLYNLWDGNGAPPAWSPSTNDPTQYLTIENGQDVILTTPDIQEISFYVGSIDSYNHMIIHYTDGTFDPIAGSLDGGWVENNTIARTGGDQHTGVTNGRLTFKFDKTVSSVEMFSSGNSFEFSSVSTTAVPEPASWALMMLGFGGLGAALRTRRRQGVATA